MAKKTFRLEQAGFDSQYAAFEGLEVGQEFDIDFGLDAERAVVAAGWVAPVEDEPQKSTKKKEG